MSTALALKALIEDADPYAQVFLDTLSGSAGEHFPIRIEHEIEQSDAVIALIGPRWQMALSTQDWVLREITYAYANGVPVIPMTHHSGSMPSLDSLPKSMRRIASQNAVHLPDEAIDGRKLLSVVSTHVNRSTPSARSSNGFEAWITGYFLYPTSPVRRTKSLSRGGLFTLAYSVFAALLIVATLGGLGFSIVIASQLDAHVIAAASFANAMMIALTSTLLGVALNAVAIVFGGVWRPIRAIAGASVFVSWYFIMSLCLPLLTLGLLRANDPGFVNYLHLAMDARPEIAIDIMDSYFADNQKANYIAMWSFYAFFVCASFYAACTMRATLAYLRVGVAIQWIVACALPSLFWIAMIGWNLVISRVE